MRRKQTPDPFVLDALANDLENIEGILRMLNSDSVVGWHEEWGRKFEREDVVEALSRLIRKDFVQAYVLTADGKALKDLPPQSLPPGDYDEAYFGLRPRGRLAHQNWEPDTVS